MSKKKDDSFEKLLEQVFTAGALSNFSKTHKGKPITQADLLDIKNRFAGYFNNNKSVLMAQLEPQKRVCVSPVTRNTIESRRGNPDMPEYMFEDFRNFEGVILGEAKNGIYPAYRVRISDDGVNYIVTTINKADIKTLS